jgi:hypothetical protein
MNKCLSYGLKLLILATSLTAFEVSAAISDTAPRKFSNGKQAKSIYTVTAIQHNSGGLETVFTCTNMNKKLPGIDLGVELFNFSGSSQNDISVDNGAILNVGPGVTRIIATADTAAFAEDVVIAPAAGAIEGGVARIVSTSPNIVCTAALVDGANAPPLSILPLPLFKGAQKGD